MSRSNFTLKELSRSGLVVLILLAAVAGQASPLAVGFDHQIEVELAADGNLRITDRLRTDGIAEYRFVLAGWLSQVKVKVDGVAAEAERRQDVYVVVLPDTGSHQIDFELRGKPPDHETSGDRGLTGSRGEDGIYLPIHGGWIPHWPGSPMRFRLEVSVPAMQRAVATGKLVDERLQADAYRASFDSLRAGEGPSLFIGPYRIAEHRAGDLRLRTYFHAEIAAEADAYLAAAERYLQRYQREVGDYPYADFHIVSAPLPVGLGFPGLTYIDRRIVPLPFMRTRSLAHEVLHNWWGNAVAVDYAGGNWAEGLTTYMADYALEREKGGAAARGMRIKWLRDYAALPVERDQPVIAFQSKQHQAAQVIGYNKAAFFFHMLAMEIGEPAFSAGLRRFWEQHRYGSAGWREMQAAFESAASRDLDWFFEQWLRRRGAPRLSLDTHVVSQVESGYLTRVELLQPVSGYRLRVPVLLTTEKGVERREIIVTTTRTSVEWLSSARPIAIQFDPDSDVFRRLQTNETPPILRDITLDPDAISVIGDDNEEFERAARELAARLIGASPRVLEAQAAAAAKRPLLLVSTSTGLSALLEHLSLSEPVQLPQVEHTAAVWTARLPGGRPVLVVSADDAAQLRALMRPLPHYGGQSYILFANGRAVQRGIWPVSRGALYRDLTD